MSMDLKTIKDLRAKITPGPWKYDGIGYIFAGEENQMIADDGGPSEEGVRIRGFGARLPMDINAQFIAQAPAMIDFLISEVERLETRIHNEYAMGNIAICYEKCEFCEG